MPDVESSRVEVEPPKARLRAAAPAAGMGRIKLWAEEAKPSARPQRTLKLARWQVAGTVSDTGGAAISGLSLRPSRATKSAVTDAAGRFTIDAAGRPDRLVCDGAGYTIVEGGELRPGRELHVVVATTRAVRFEVRSAATGLPLVAANLAPCSSGVDSRLLRTTATQVDGSAILELAAGECLVAVSRPGFQAIDATVHAGASSLVVELQPALPPESLTGRVLTPAGEPIAGASLALGEARTTSRHDGTFTIAAADGRDDTSLPHAFLHGYHPRHGRAAVDLARQGAELQVVLVGDPAATKASLARGPKLLAHTRLVPLTESGTPNLFAPAWLTAQSNANAEIALPSASRATDYAAVAKDGTDLGRLRIVDGEIRWLSPTTPACPSRR